VEKALEAAGFSQVQTVTEQREPDGRFPTVKFPNPEEPGATDLLLALAASMPAELAVANDPDADRLSIAVRKPDGTYKALTGDQVGILLGAQMLEAHAGSKRLAVGRTIVSSRMLRVIAQACDATHFETLTGFKWIAAAADKAEARGERFVFGYEEALGYTIGSVVRDKDGISAALVLCEMAAALKAEGRTLLDQLEQLYRTYGLFMTRQVSLWLDPDASSSPGDSIRQQTIERIGEQDVTAYTDLARSERRHSDGTIEKIDLPSSDVLIYTLADDSRVLVRPSGTEPKLKCYYEVREHITQGEAFLAAQTRAEQKLDAMVAAHQQTLKN